LQCQGRRRTAKKVSDDETEGAAVANGDGAVSAPPKVTGPILNFGSNEDEQTTPKRSREPTSPEEAIDGANKKQRVQKSAAALTDELGKMLDEMIAKFTDTKSNNKKVVRHVTQATMDSLHAMKKLQSEISATLDESRARGPATSATQQTTPSLSAPRQEDTSIKRTHTGAGNPGRVAPRNPPWQQVRPKTKKPHVTAASNGESESHVNRTTKRRNQRSDVILIKCSEESYADMLKLVKTEPTLQGLKDGVQGIRRTANGSLLLKMKKPSDPATKKMHTAIKSAFSGKAEVAMLEDTVQVEIRDLDEMTTCEKVLQAVYAEEECDIPAGAAPRMRKAYGGTQTATVHLRPEHAQRILDKGKIRVGWVVCRIRQKTETAG